MTLEQIRSIKTNAELNKAIMELSDKMQTLTYGEFMAIRNTIQTIAKELGIDSIELNRRATEYQIRGQYALEEK